MKNIIRIGYGLCYVGRHISKPRKRQQIKALKKIMGVLYYYDD